MLIFFYQIAVAMGIRNLLNFSSRGAWVAAAWVPCLIAMPAAVVGAAMSWWMLGCSYWGAMDVNVGCHLWLMKSQVFLGDTVLENSFRFT